MANHVDITERSDPVFVALKEQQRARVDLLEASMALDKATEAVDQATARLAAKERRLLATQPATKQGAVALLGYLASVIEPHEDIAPLALPALAAVKGVLI